MKDNTIFFSKLFQSRDTIHLCHLATESFAGHVAMDEFYKGIIELTDSLVEMYQGKYGIIKIPIPPSNETEPISFLEELADWIETNKDEMFEDSFLLNQIDSILELTYTTIYKLKNLS